MHNFFNEDAPFMRTLAAAGDLMIANLLFLICAFPIVTAGPALSAVYSVMHGLLEHNCDSVAKSFFIAFRKNFRVSLVAGCISIFCLCVMAADLWFLIETTIPDLLTIIFFGIWICIFIILISVLSYLFPLISRYENSLIQHIRNAALLSISQLFRTVVIILLNTFPVVLLLFLPPVFLYLTPFWILIGFAGIFRLDILVLKPIFNQLDELSQAQKFLGNRGSGKN